MPHDESPTDAEFERGVLLPESRVSQTFPRFQDSMFYLAEPRRSFPHPWMCSSEHHPTNNNRFNTLETSDNPSGNYFTTPVLLPVNADRI